MFVTEEEAKTKWCPADHTNCVGSSCMAWRWENPFQKKPSAPTKGCCGLAWKPER